jgi:hypothetical protein
MELAGSDRLHQLWLRPQGGDVRRGVQGAGGP